MANDRILTTHAGSLPRPEAVLRMLCERDEGREQDIAANEALLARAVGECVDRQVAAGIDIVSDGELGKPSYATYVKDRLTGFSGESDFPRPADLARYPDYARVVLGHSAITSLKTPACNGPIAYRDRYAITQELSRFRDALRGRARGFVTAASPGVIALYLKNRHYRSHESYLDILSHAMKAEYRAVHDAGFVLQLDCPDLAMSGHMQYAGLSLKEFRKTLAQGVEALNHAVADIPPERMRIHVCWGNYSGPHDRDVELKDIIDILLSARPRGISFAAANPRHAHEWAVWQQIHIPEDKVLIPGVIDSTTNFVEHPALISERILRFVNIVGADRVIAGTDCGFSTFAGLSVVHPSIAWAKLEALAQGAEVARRALRTAPRPQIVVAHS
jgi:5-methyltetrahydropteroyltriglutamate--homocysteine methyltransferase